MDMDKLKEMLVSTVEPMLEQYGKNLNEKIASQIDEKITSLTPKPEEKAPIIMDTTVEDPKGGFKSLSHFARDVAFAEKDPRRGLTKELEAWTKKAAGSGLLEGDSDYGGYLIPVEFRNTLMTIVESANEFVPRCTPVAMATNIIEIPYVAGFDESGGLVWGGIQWKWLDELAQKTETRPKFGKIQMKLKKIAGLAYTSDEILQDSPQSMEGILRQGFADGLNFQLNKVILRGTGAGQPLGIFNAPCKLAIAKEAGQGADTILFENIVKMYSRQYNRGKAVWVVNPECLPQLATMSMAVGTGGVPVYLPANGIAGAPYDSLMGKPIIWSDFASALGDEGDIMLVDFSQYLVGQKSGGTGVQFDTSIHLKFDYDQTCFRFVFRIEGQPWWPSAMTPAYGAATRSPFITLAARA